MDGQTASQESGWAGVHCRHGTVLSALDAGPSPSRKMQTRHVDTHHEGWSTLTNGCRRGSPSDHASPSAAAVNDDDDDDDHEAYTTYVDQRRQSDMRAAWPDHTASDKCRSVIWVRDVWLTGPSRPVVAGKHDSVVSDAVGLRTPSVHVVTDANNWRPFNEDWCRAFVTITAPIPSRL